MQSATPRKLGPVLATLFVAGNMIGSGLFLLPATLGQIGGISILTWGLATVGALVIAAVFARLGVIAPWAGGPYAYARATLGRYLGFHTNYIYWICVWVGNVGIALAVSGYVMEFLPGLKTPLGSALITSAVIWIMIAVNIVGPRIVASMEGATLCLGLAPILVIATWGWTAFDPAIFAASWNVSGVSIMQAVPASMVLVFWAFTGLESAAVAVEVIEDPTRNLPIAVMAGVGIAAVVYAASCSVVMGIVPAHDLAASSAPFALVAGHLFGPLAATVLSLTAILKAAGTHAGWTLVSAATAKAAADGGSFPSVFGWVDARGIPVAGLVILGGLMTAASFATMSPTVGEQFSKLIDVSTVFCLMAYVYSALALGLLPGRHPRRRLIDRFLAAGAVIVSASVILASDWQLLLIATAIAASSVPLYPFYRGHRTIEFLPSGAIAAAE